MARTDRLMRLMTALRSLPAPVTAARLAAETDVSPRQLYRDIATLRAGGALIDGAPGVGYTLTEDPALPPQSFDRLEIEALMVALSALEQIGDDALATAGRAAVARIIATLPDRMARQALHHTMMTWRPAPDRPEVTIDMDLLRRNCWDERSLRIRYRDAQDRVTDREVWPLAMSYSDRSLMLMAHCRMRMDFRSFNIARIAQAEDGGDTFRPHRVPLLREFVARYRDD
ncbi:helix-turn-helix transcriptional regulator [Pseudooceanicola onchidii]|uniref:helix-turn-helix transcriptional regulator n=1 Tax=Pseudooceanicola onchidii TaxID=2562279 RepID=UPI0010AB1EE4|nr:YafY family protein [Pseudooceanicola onchidii]